MRLEELEDYDAKEKAVNQSYWDKAASGKIRLEDNPHAERFHNLKSPVGIKAVNCAPWSQAPLFGSLIIPIFPVRQEKFAEVHGFGVRDLARLIDYSKDTGRIQFTLASNPLDFANLDYFDALLYEIKPPFLTGLVPNTDSIDNKLYSQWNVEFLQSAQISLWPLLRDSYGSHGLTERYARQRLESLRNAYVGLNILGYEKSVKAIFDALVVDSSKAHKMLYLYNALIVKPWMNPMNVSQCFSLEYLKSFDDADKEDKITKITEFPCEVGAFLLDELALVPESFESCKNVIERYRQEDLQKVYEALNKAIQESDVDASRAKSAELATILRNVWDDARKFRGHVEDVSHGVSLGLSVAGNIAGALALGPVGSIAGIFTRLGIRVIDDGIESLSEKALGITRKSQVLVIYDFQKKHNL